MSDRAKNEKEKLLKGSFFVLLANVAGMGSIFATRVITGRYLGPGKFGILILALTIVQILTMVSLTGLSSGLAQRVPRSEDPTVDFTNSIIFVGTFSTAIAGTFYLFKQSLIEILNVGSSSNILVMFVLVLPLYAITKLSIGYVRGHEDVVGRVLIKNVTLQVIVFISVYTIIYLHGTLDQVILAWGIIFGISPIVSLAYIKYTYGELFSGFDIKQGVDLVTFSAPLMISQTLWLVMQKTDNLLLAFYKSPFEVGVYDSAYTLGRVLLMLTTALGFLFLPVMSGLDRDNKQQDLKDLYAFATKSVTFLALLPLSVYLTYPRAVIGFVFGDSFSFGSFALVILSLGFFSHNITGNNGYALTALGLTRSVAVGSFLAAIINIILNILLIPQFSIAGAATASAVAYILVNIMYAYVLNKEAEIQPFSRELIQTITAAGGIIVILNIIPIQPEGFIQLIVFAGIESGLVLLVVYLIGLSEEDIKLISKQLPV